MAHPPHRQPATTPTPTQRASRRSEPRTPVQALRRLRIETSRSWRPWILVTLTLGFLGATQVTTGWLAAVAGVGCTLSVIALWLVLTLRRDRTRDDGEDMVGDPDVPRSASDDSDGLEAAGGDDDP